MMDNATLQYKCKINANKAISSKFHLRSCMSLAKNQGERVGVKLSFNGGWGSKKQKKTITSDL